MIERFSSAHLPALVRFWNEEFAGRPRFRRMTLKGLGARLKDPQVLLLATEGDLVMGLLHGGVSSEQTCRRRVKGWPGGTQGYVALLWVSRAKRRQGIGGELWRAGREALGGAKQVVIDSDGRNPWYARPPAWGAPWGPAVEWRDLETRKFLAMRGYGARAKAVEFKSGVVVPDAEPERYAALVKRGVKRVAEWTLF